jgi:signal transduction histidine kinase
MKSTFVSVAAHELRTPLTSIKGYLELLLDDEAETLTDTQQQYLEIVQRGAERLLTITNNLLDANRIATERMDLVLWPTDLLALAQAVALEFHPALAAKGQDLIFWAQPNLPLALCNKTRTSQILSNLLSNANKYTPTGGQITISLFPAQTEGFIQVSVTDNGVGIPLADRAELFSRFFRASNAGETGAGGTGLGLYITRSLVEQQGGTIWFESKAGQGTTFHVTFPIADQPATALADEDL